MVRILHVSDTHLGKRQYKSDERQQDYADAFSESIEIAIEEQVDAVIHTGDLFDDPNPHSSTLKKACDIIKKLEPHDIPFYAIVGNHERKRKAQWMDVIESLEIAQRLGSEPIYVGDTALYGIDSVRRTAWENTDKFELQDPDDSTEFVLVCMHELVYPPVPEHIYEQSKSVYTLESLVEKLDTSVDAVALGDYHQRCREEKNGVSVFYPGSTEKTAKNEPDIKSVDVLEIEDGKVKRNRKTLESPREFKTIDISVVSGMTSADLETKLDSYSFEGAVLEVVLTGSNEAAFTTQQVRSAGVRKGATVVDVVDERESQNQVPNVEDLDYDVTDIESVVDESVNELGLSETAESVEQVVRDTGEITTLDGVESHARDIVESDAPSIDEGDSE